MGSPPPESDITRLLQESSGSNDDAAAAREALLAHVYGELHRMAQGRIRQERPDHTLGATGLVSEAYLSLFGTGRAALNARDRAAFFGAAATAMRRILVDHARARSAGKRGGGSIREPITLDAVAAACTAEPEQFIALDEAIDALEQFDGRAATVVRLRFFGGMDGTAIADLLEINERTVKRDWQFARAWLRDALSSLDGNADSAT